MGDETYRDQPAAMTDDTIDALVDRTLAHCLEYGVDSFTFALRGGEPLMVGSARIARLVDRSKIFSAHGIAVRFAIQTNGTYLTDR